ncbi:MAG: type I restriction enzyme HsdR N-terminal domain-containing protein [Actinobacteria bacterium]|nr:type I restriction enzyme HsdR N-terminal domain-containing protein [Actinomycetota bacterium]
MEAGAGADGLRQTLENVAERIERYRDTRIGEQNTKATLIVPVLRALGWNVEDLDEVHLEYKFKSQDKPVDYALMLQRKPVLFIEAKGLDEDLNDRRWASQIVSYAAVAGVEWVMLTNGDGYRIYNAHAPVALDEKLFRSIQISGDAPEAADALRLLTKDELRRKSLQTLWQAQSIDNRVRQAVEALFEPEPSPWLVRRLARSIEGLSPGDVRAALSRARITLDFPAADLAGLPEVSAVKPTPTPKPAGTRQAATRYDVTVKQLLEAGLIAPGAQLRQRYLGRDVTATIEADGRVRVGGEVYNSLSIAAGAARVAVKGPPPDGRSYYQTNGWTFWEYADRDGKQQPMEALRKRYLSDRSSV